MAPKLHGRAFYESLGSPKHILAPMVDQSEFAWRLLTRSFLPPELRTSVLAYSPMLHAKLFGTSQKYRDEHFKAVKPVAKNFKEGKEGGDGKGDVVGEAHLDGNPAMDRPLFVQFCANDPELLLEAAKHVQAHCDAVDLNLGCPQGIARKGHYGAFLQEDQDLIYRLINTLHKGLDIPVTAKMRILDTKEKTLDYAKVILNAGASILTVHGRQREQKGHLTGLADWDIIRYLRESLPKETVLFANGNILQYWDLQRGLDATGADGIMSAEANLYDPAIFAPAPEVGEEGREYWRGRDGKGGWRADAVLRRYLDILHTHVLGQEAPERAPLFLPSDPVPKPAVSNGEEVVSEKRKPEEATPQDADAPPTKKQKKQQGRKFAKPADTNLGAMQAHLFHMLRALVSKHTNVRDALARCRAGDMDAYEHVLSLTEAAVKEGLLDYEKDPSTYEYEDAEVDGDGVTSDAAVKRCKRPFWVCQSHVRPLPKEALEKGSIQLSKKAKAQMAQLEETKERDEAEEVGLPPGGSTELVGSRDVKANGEGKGEEKVEVPKEGLVCG